MFSATGRSRPVGRVPLAEALALGPGVWANLLARSGACSPFMSWAWHRAWTEASGSDAADSAQVLVVRSAAGALATLFPFRIHRARFRKAPVTALGWAIGDLGCPDHLEFLASPEADLDTVVAALEDLPWE